MTSKIATHGSLRCIGCWKTKLATQFYLVRRGETRRQSRCKSCDNAARRESMYRLAACSGCGGKGHTWRSPRCPKRGAA